MGLFKFFNKNKEKKQEQINLNFEEQKTEELISINTFQKEEKVIVKTDDELRKEIVFKFNKINRKNEFVIKEYFTCKLLSRVGLRDLDFNLQVVAIDKHINRIKKDCFELTRVIETIKAGLTFETEQLIAINKQLDDLQAFQVGVLNLLSEITNSGYGNLKISTVTVTMNKSNEELEILYNNISSELKHYKSFDEASEVIYYNSGDFLDNLVNCFLNYVKGTGNSDYIITYDKKYFLGGDAVISLEIKEWIDLYNKLKYVLKFIGNYEPISYKKCHELFDVFEAKYAILMMRTETQNIK